MPPILERAATAVLLLVALSIALIGVWLSRSTGDLHWMNRCGAMIVCTESLIVLIEFSRRLRIRKIEEKFGQSNPYVVTEGLRAERRIVFIGVLMAVLGEFLHGFGDLILEMAKLQS